MAWGQLSQPKKARQIAAITAAVIAVLLCYCGGCAILLIAPDAVAAFSPFNW